MIMHCADNKMTEILTNYLCAYIFSQCVLTVCVCYIHIYCTVFNVVVFGE